MKRASILSVVLLVAGCSVTASDESQPTFVYHSPDRMLPFPSDRYLAQGSSLSPTAEKGTGYRVMVGKFEATDPALTFFPGVAESLADLDGFGTSAEIAVGVSASPDVEWLADEANAYLRSVSDASPIRLISIDPADAEAGAPVPFVARPEPDGATLFLRPWLPLRPGGWYAVVFRNGLRDVGGRRFVAPAGFADDYAAGRGEGLEGEGYQRLRQVYRGSPLFALTFRTASVYPKLEGLLAKVRAAAPAPYTYTTRPATGYADISLIVEGEFLHKNFRDADGRLSDNVVGEELIKFTLTLPKTNASVSEPFALALGQHGLNDKRQAVFRFANAYARAGVATVAIDAPNHGSRGPGEGLSYDSLRGARETLGVWTDGERMTFKAWRFRDIVRQQVLDHQQILGVMAAFDEDIDRAGNQPGADIDGAAPVYTGQSMGGIIGGVSGAVNTELRRVLLNVPGGRISNILVRNEVLGDMLIALLKPRTISFADAYRMVAMVQAVIDPGDPINYVGRIAGDPTAPRPLLIQAALGDATLPNIASYDLARAAGARYVGPYATDIPGLPLSVIGSSALGGDDLRVFAFFEDIVVEGEPATADHGNLWASDTAVDQALAFLLDGQVAAVK